MDLHKIKKVITIKNFKLLNHIKILKGLLFPSANKILTIAQKVGGVLALSSMRKQIKRDETIFPKSSN